MLRKVTITGSVLILISTLVYAHEFWLEPQKFLLKIGEKIKMAIFVGENFEGETSDFTKFKVNKFTHYSPQNEKNISGDLTENVVNEFLNFDSEGNHLIVFNNSNKFIELEADKFNEYLKEDGLDNIIALRKKQNKTNQKGLEYYQRCVKTLIQVGNSQNDLYKKNTGMRLELIPDKNPYSVSEGETITFKVIFDNKPLNNALVVVWQKGVSEKTIAKRFRSDTNGNIKFAIDKKGKWMVSTVRMIEIKDPKANYQSFWGSYTFGYN